MNKLTRRNVIGGGVVLVAGSWLAAQGVGHRPMAGRPSACLGGAALWTLRQACEALLAADADAEAVAQGVDAFLAGSDPRPAHDLWLGLTVLEHVGNAGVFSFSRFSRLSREDRAAILAEWAESSFEFKRRIYLAVRKIACFGWYASPEAWDDIGYDGPWV